MRPRLAWILWAAACLTGAEPKFVRNLFPASGGEPIDFGKAGETRFVRFPGGKWIMLTGNDTPDAHVYTMGSYIAYLGNSWTVHLIGDRYAVIEGKRFAGIYGPSDETLQGPNALPLPALRESFRLADQRINAKWKQLRPRLEPGEQRNHLLGEQRAWIAAKEKYCRQFAMEEAKLQCATAFTIARQEVLEAFRP